MTWSTARRSPVESRASISPSGTSSHAVTDLFGHRWTEGFSSRGVSHGSSVNLPSAQNLLAIASRSSEGSFLNQPGTVAVRSIRGSTKCQSEAANRRACSRARRPSACQPRAARYLRFLRARRWRARRVRPRSPIAVRASAFPCRLRLQVSARAQANLLCRAEVGPPRPVRCSVSLVYFNLISRAAPHQWCRLLLDSLGGPGSGRSAPAPTGARSDRGYANFGELTFHALR